MPPCVGTAIFSYLGSLPTRPFVSRLLSLRPLVGLGRISYSLYLVHWPLLLLVSYIQMRTPSTLGVVIAVATSLLLATLLYVWVERPIQAGSAAPRLVFGATVVVVAGLAGAGRLGPSLQERLVPLLAQSPAHDPENVVAHVVREETCLLYGPAIDVDRWQEAECVRTTGQGGDILLWGDSFAAHYSGGLDAVGARVHGRVIQYTAQGCPPLLAGMDTSCTKFDRNALAVISRERIGRVILAANWSEYPVRDVERVSATFTELTRLGVMTVMIGQTPAFFTDPAVILARRDQASALDAFASIDVDASGLNGMLARHARLGGAGFIDPMPHMCPGDPCAVRVGGENLYLDYGHYSIAGSRRAVRAYFPFMVR